MKISGILCIFSRQAEWPNSANAFIVPDTRGFSLMDVGCGGDGGIGQLRAGLAHWSVDPKRIHTVVCSHAHPDHMGALKWLLQQCTPLLRIHHKDIAAAQDPYLLQQSFDIPLAKRRWSTARGVSELDNFELLDFFRDSGCLMNAAYGWKALDGGDELKLGERRFQVIHTPGHSPGHVSFFERKTGVLLAGDIVGKSPAWYTPTSGGVDGYLESLNNMERLDPAILLPSHGPAAEDPKTAIRTIRGKLLRREEALLSALKKKSRSYMELLETLFSSPYLHFFPGIGILESHLLKLQADGKIQETERDTVYLPIERAAGRGSINK